MIFNNFAMNNNLWISLTEVGVLNNFISEFVDKYGYKNSNKNKTKINKIIKNYEGEFPIKQRSMEKYILRKLKMG